MTSPAWALQPGDTLTRDQIHGVYGGDAETRIAPSERTPNVLLYFDFGKPVIGDRDLNGWDESGQVYFYTGEPGDAAGNAAITDHHTDGTALRLFVAVGTQAGRGVRVYRYVGRFDVDPDRPYASLSGTGADDATWPAPVFRLRPVGVVDFGGRERVSVLANGVP